MHDVSAFQSLTIESFRGFRDRQTLDMRASAVLLMGRNGTGKTSVFDAMQWLLLGSLDRFDDLRERRNDEHIVNCYSASGPAMVEAEMEINGHSLTIRRTGTYRDSSLELVAGTEVLRDENAQITLDRMLMPTEDVPLDTTLATSGLLQQDVMHGILKTRPRDMYRQLTGLLGLDELESFEDAAQSQHRNAKELAALAENDLQNLTADSDRVTEQREQRVVSDSARPPINNLRKKIAARIDDLRPTVTLKNGISVTSDDALLLATELVGLATEIEAISSNAEELSEKSDGRTLATPEDDELAQESVKAAQSDLVRVQDAADRAKSTADEAKRHAENTQKLAALAIPLLTDVCPVCTQSIDPEHVAELLESNTSAVEVLLLVENRLTNAEKDVDSARGKLKVATDSAMEVSLQLTVALRLDKERTDLLQRLQAITEDRPLIVVDQSVGVFDVERPKSLHRLAKQLRKLERLFQQLATALNQQDDNAITAYDRRLKTLRADLKRAEERLDDLRSRESAASTFLDATKDARVRVAQERFAALEPFAQEIFTRLDPHPSFKDLRFEHEVYRAKGTTAARVTDQAKGISANPLIVFSSAQASVTALAYFLAMGWLVGAKALPFVLLDDPLQSMDDVNVLGFADLCRAIRSDRQLVVATHEARFANLLERKLTPRVEGLQTIVHEFRGWDRQGPVIETRHVESQLFEAGIRALDAG